MNNHILKESQIQSTIIEWFRFSYSDYIIAANSNGGYKISYNEGRRLKKEGLLPGYPDCSVFTPYGMFFIEFKSVKGKLSVHQRNIINKLESMNYRVIIIREIDSGIRAIEEEILSMRSLHNH